MKRLFATLTIALSFISLTSFAHDKETPDAALQSFKSSFKNATEVSWTATNDYYKATFTLNGQNVSAFYDGDGKMIAITRNISPSQMPIVLQSNIKKDYENFWISNLFEVASDQGTNYYITLENADTRLVLKSIAGEWNVYHRERKS